MIDTWRLSQLLNCPASQVTPELLESFKAWKSQWNLAKDTTSLRNEKYRTCEPDDGIESKMVTLLPESIIVHVGNMVIYKDCAYDGVATMIEVDDKDLLNDFGYIYKTIDVRFREGEAISVLLEVMPPSKNVSDTIKKTVAERWKELNRLEAEQSETLSGR